MSNSAPPDSRLPKVPFSARPTRSAKRKSRQQLRPNVKQHLLTRHIAGQAGRPSGGARRVVSSPQRELTTRARTSSLRALM